MVINNEENSSDKSKAKVGDYLGGGGQKNPSFYFLTYDKVSLTCSLKSEEREKGRKGKEATAA